jgi:hypothetical protein
MSKSNSGVRGTNATSKHKGESEPSRQKGAASISNKNKEKHKKDDSDGAEKNTTKKQQNSI